MAACVVAAAAGVVAAAECLHSACPAGPADAAARYLAAMTSRAAARPTPAGVRAGTGSWRSDTPPPLRGSARTARQVPAAAGPAQAVGVDGAVAESANSCTRRIILR